MLSTLLNKKYARFLAQAIILFAAVVILLNLLHSWVLPCGDNRLVSEDFNKENSIIARIKIDNRGGGMVRFVASFEPDDLLRIWNNRQATPQPFKSGDIPLVKIKMHNPRLCSNQAIEWIIFIITKPSNFEQRIRLRATWASVHLFKNHLTKVVFVMGQAHDMLTQDRIEEEFAMYEDLVQGDFADLPHMGTLKSVLGLKWVSENCKHARFTFKANDFSFVNIFGLMDLAKSHMKDHRNIMCPLWLADSMPILRKNCGDYCVPAEDFPDKKFFPQYCAGVGFLSHTAVIEDLYIASLSTPSFIIEDVYTTGILPTKLSHPPKFISCMSNFSGNLELISTQYSNTSYPIEVLITITQNATVFDKLWTSLINRLQPEWFSQLSDQTIKKYVSDV